MHSGKSIVGKIISKKLKRDRFDTDRLIEERMNLKVKDIFIKFGEERFRELEKEVIDELLRNKVTNSIIVTGGGMPMHCKKIKKLGKVLFLNRDIDEIVELITIKEIKKRPLFGDADSVKKLYYDRVDTYRKLANMEFVLKNNAPLKVAYEIMRKIK